MVAAGVEASKINLVLQINAKKRGMPISWTYQDVLHWFGAKNCAWTWKVWRPAIVQRLAPARIAPQQQFLRVPWCETKPWTYDG